MPEDFQKVKGFFVYFDQCEALEDLTDEQAGMLFKGIVARFQGREFDFTDQTVRVVFRFFEVAFRQEQEKYKQICEKRRENIKKRWHTNENKTIQNDTKDTSVYKCIPDDTNEKKAIQNIPYLNPEPEPELNININTKERGTNAPNATPKKERAVFVPPTALQVAAYANENGYRIDAQRFVDFYASKGWFVGKNKMKDWQAAVRNWVHSDKTRASPAQSNNGRGFNLEQQAQILRDL